MNMSCAISSAIDALTFAPSLSKWSAMPAPMPEDAPTNTTTASFRR